MTLISRVLGFIRDMMIARIFGVDIATDAFFVAFKLPNFLRRLFAEGAFAHAFVPILTDYRQRHDDLGLKTFIDKAAGGLALLFMLAALLGIAAAPLLVWLLAPGFAGQGAQHDLATAMLRIMCPYLVFIALVAFAGSVLNVYRRFAIPAITPAILNITMIVAATQLAPLLAEPIIALAWGVLLAGVLQLLLQVPALLRLRLMPRLRVDVHDASVKRARKLLLPTLFSASITQINLLLDTMIASFLAVGSVSWLYYSERLVEFPIGILGFALATVSLPNLAKHHAADDAAAFSAALTWGLRLGLLTGLPAMVGLVALAEPILSTLFQDQAFTADDVRQAGRSLKAYALGLPAYILLKVLTPGFTARQDVATPLRYGIYAMLVSVALNVLAWPFAHAGLALATSLGALFNIALLLRKLACDGVLQADGWPLFVVRVMLACIAMYASLYVAVDIDAWPDWDSGTRIINLLKGILLAAAVYGAALALTGFRLRQPSLGARPD